MGSIRRAEANTLAQTLPETFEAQAVRLGHVAPLFARMADGMLLSWRRALGVPDHADAEVEGELAAVRKMFDEQFLPEFARLYAELLQRHLRAATSAVLVALADENVQGYLAVVDRVETDLAALLREYLPRMKAALSRAT
ncbi:MAG: hypothetical protein RL685_4845 [Pseudomonadota bacterium]|jgi:hypothetical protein